MKSPQILLMFVKKIMANSQPERADPNLEKEGANSHPEKTKKEEE